MTPDELAYLRELHEEASPAPWFYQILPVNLRTGDQDSVLVDSTGNEIAYNPEEPFTEDDFDVMFEYRNAFPALLDHIDRVTERAERAEARLGRVARNHPAVYEQALAGDDQ